MVGWFDGTLKCFGLSSLKSCSLLNQADLSLLARHQLAQFLVSRLKVFSSNKGPCLGRPASLVGWQTPYWWQHHFQPLINHDSVDKPLLIYCHFPVPFQFSSGWSMQSHLPIQTLLWWYCGWWLHGRRSGASLEEAEEAGGLDGLHATWTSQIWWSPFHSVVKAMPSSALHTFHPTFWLELSALYTKEKGKTYLTVTASVKVVMPFLVWLTWKRLMIHLNTLFSLTPCLRLALKAEPGELSPAFTITSKLL